MKIPIAGGFYEARAGLANSQELVNMYVEQNPQGEGEVVMYTRPGTTAAHANLSAGTTFYGLLATDDFLYTHADTSFKKFNTSFTAVDTDTVPAGAGLKSMATDGNGVLVADQLGTKSSSYYYDISAGTATTFAAAANFPTTPGQVVVLDGYFIVSDLSTTGRFYISDQYDGSPATGWNGLFATAERSADKLRAMKVINRQLWLFGSKTVELWYNTGAATFPLSPLPNGFIEYGCSASWSVQAIGGYAYWLGENEQGEYHVVRSSGAYPEIISTPAISSIIKEHMDSISPAEAALNTTVSSISFTLEGHTFYVLSFNNGSIVNQSYVYDTTTGLWAKWGRPDTPDTVTDTDKHFPSHRYAYFSDKHIVIDKSPSDGLGWGTSEIAYIDADTYDDTLGSIDSNFQKYRTTAVAHGDGKWMRHDKFSISCEFTGSGTVTLSWSDDGGATFSSGVSKSVTSSTNELIWNRLGRSKRRIYKIQCDDAIGMTIVQGFIDVEPYDEDIRA